MFSLKNKVSPRNFLEIICKIKNKCYVVKFVSIYSTMKWYVLYTAYCTVRRKKQSNFLITDTLSSITYFSATVRLLDYPRRDGQAEWTLATCNIPKWFTHPYTVTHPSINRARRRVTSWSRPAPYKPPPSKIGLSKSIYSESFILFVITDYIAHHLLNVPAHHCYREYNSARAGKT